MAVGELEFAQHAAHVRLDGLDRDEQLLGDLLVRVAAGDQPQDLAFALGELVEFGVDRGASAAAKASSTKPASRGENTASPSATRPIALVSSGPEIVLVT